MDGGVRIDGNEATVDHAFPAAAFRLAAQYFFILAPTALRCAAVIGLRCLRRTGVADAVPAGVVVAFGPRFYPAVPERRSGNMLTGAFTSAFSSWILTSAPRRARDVMSSLVTEPPFEEERLD